MTDAKAKRMGIKAATGMVALGHSTVPLSRIRIRRTHRGIHLSYCLDGLVKVTTFVPREAIRIKLSV